MFGVLGLGFGVWGFWGLGLGFGGVVGGLVGCTYTHLAAIAHYSCCHMYMYTTFYTCIQEIGRASCRERV